MKAFLPALLALLLAPLAALPAAEARPNVLLIVSDDLANTLGCYGFPAAQTPNLDALAARGMRFDRAYCQFPHCNPSRSSFLTGLRPHTTRVTNNADVLYKNLPGVMTLPHHFRDHGYATARCGKIFHLGIPKGDESMDDPQAWDFGTPFKSELPYPPKRASAVDVGTTKGHGIGWQEIPVEDELLVDGGHANAAVGWLERRDASKPFFLAVGFHRPHLPLVAPAKYFDLYPLESIKLPPEPADDEADIPAPARNGAVPGYTVTATPDQRRATLRGYLASVSYMDAQAGRVLDAIARLGLAERTIVIFTSDHGWHLGEHGLWHKRSLFEECARVPLIVSIPGMKTRGQTTGGLAELVDLFPTLCDLTGVPPLPTLQGRSLRPLLDDPRATVHEAAFSEARRGTDAEFWGRSVRTARWRYTEWNGGADGVELYDHDADPREFTNLANDPQHAATLAALKKRLTGPTTPPPAAAIALALLASPAIAAPKTKPSQANTDDMWVQSPVPELPAGVTHHTYRSDAMKRDVGYCIYLPPRYENDPKRRYPVIYHLHGAGGNECRSVYSAKVLHEGILAGRWPELIMVFPNGGRSTMYQDSADGRFMAETTFIQELMPHIDARYRTIAEPKARCIEGFSMGGRGSTNLAMKHPGLFCSLFNQSGNVYHVSDKSKLPNPYLGDDPERLRANDAFLNLQKNLAAIKAGLRIQVACGTADPDHLTSVREYHAALTAAGVAHSYFEVEGLAHNQGRMIDGRKDTWFDFHIDSLRRGGVPLHSLKP